MTAEDRAAAVEVLHALGAASAALREAFAAEKPALAALVTAAREAVTALSLSRAGAPLAFVGPDGEALAGLFDELAGAEAVMPPGGTARDCVASIRRWAKRDAAGDALMQATGMVDDHVASCWVPAAG